MLYVAQTSTTWGYGSIICHILFFLIHIVAGNIITFSFGAGLAFTTCSYMLWITDETPLPSGKLTVFEASLVTSLLCIGSLFGNFLFVSLSAKFGRKIPLLFLAIPQIVSNTWTTSANDPIKFIDSIFTVPIGELVSDLCCNECLLSVCGTISGGCGWWRCILFGAGLRFRNCRRQVRIRFYLLIFMSFRKYHSCRMVGGNITASHRAPIISQEANWGFRLLWVQVFLIQFIFQRPRYVGLSFNAVM